MAISFCFTPSSNPSLSPPLSKLDPDRSFAFSFSSSSSSSPASFPHLRLTLSPSPTLRHHQKFLTSFAIPNDAVLAGGDDDDGNNNKNKNSGGNGGNNGGEHGGEHGNAGDKNRKEAMMVLAEAGRLLENLPKDLRAAIESGRVPGSVVVRFLELEKSGLFRWLMQFGGFKERLLADDLFLAKVGIECGVGIFTKTAAEYERRRENFFNELEIVFADVVFPGLCGGLHEPISLTQWIWYEPNRPKSGESLL